MIDKYEYLTANEIKPFDQFITFDRKKINTHR